MPERLTLSLEEQICMREELSGDRYSITRAQYQENKVNMKETSNSLILQKEQVDIGTYKRFICGFLDILEPLTKLKKKILGLQIHGYPSRKSPQIVKDINNKEQNKTKSSSDQNKATW